VTNCEKCSELLAQYHDSVATFVESGKRLAMVAVGQETDLYKRMFDEYQKAFLECRDMRKLILTHLEYHGGRP
jgi:hypothetical protein